MPPDPTPAPCPGPASAVLKLRARVDEDLHALAALLQDSLVPLSDMLYEPELRRFALVVNRFMWEAPGTEAQAGTETRADGEGGEPVHARVHGVLAIHEVGAVRIRDIDRTHPATPPRLLTPQIGRASCRAHDGQYG